MKKETIIEMKEIELQQAKTQPKHKGANTLPQASKTVFNHHKRNHKHCRKMLQHKSITTEAAKRITKSDIQLHHTANTLMGQKRTHDQKKFPRHKVSIVP